MPNLVKYSTVRGVLRRVFVIGRFDFPSERGIPMLSSIWNFILSSFFYGAPFGAIGLVAWWLYVSYFNYAKPTEQLIAVRRGNPDPEPYVDGSGAIWLPLLPARFKYFFRSFPTDRFDLDFEVIKVLSKEGVYPPVPAGMEGKEKKEWEEKNWRNSVGILVNGDGYLTFPTRREMLVDKQTGEPVCFVQDLSDDRRESLRRAEDENRWLEWEATIAVPARGTVPEHNVTVVLERVHPLIVAYKMGVPTTTAEITDKTKEGYTAAVWAAAAQMTWKEATENPKGAFSERVRRGFMENQDGSLIKLGFRPSGIDIAIQTVDIPDEMKQRFAEREAAPAAAEASAIRFDDTSQALEKWKVAHPEADVDEKQQELARRAYLAAGGQYQEIHGLENADTAVFGGGGNTLVGINSGGGKGGGKPKKGKGARPLDNDDGDVL